MEGIYFVRKYNLDNPRSMAELLEDEGVDPDDIYCFGCLHNYIKIILG